MIPIYQKEIKAYIHSLTASLFFALFMAASGIYFSVICLNQGYGDYAKYVLANISFIYIILIPLLTMRLLAREREQRTEQLLLTSPLAVRDLVLGKYLAAASLLAVSMLICLVQAGILGSYVQINWPGVLTGIAGFFFFGLCLLAIGLFISSCSANTMTAGALTFSAILLIMMAPNVYEILPERARYTYIFAAVLIAAAAVWMYLVTENSVAAAVTAAIGAGGLGFAAYLIPDRFDRGLAGIISWCSMTERFQEFCEGSFSISSTVFFLSLAALFLYMTTWQIESRRWL